MVAVSAPGKLMIAGEWGVLEGGPAVVAAVEQRVTVHAEDADRIHFSLPGFGIETDAAYDERALATESGDVRLAFVRAAAETVMRYIGSSKPFALTTHGSSTKYGFGSSAAVTVAAVGALLRLHGRPLHRNVIFRLSSIAHCMAQGTMGSGFDVAAATYGGVFAYRRFDARWVKENEEHPAVLAGTPWPRFSVEPLAMPAGMRLLVGWTGQVASTPTLLGRMQAWKAAHAGSYLQFMEEISSIVERLIVAWKMGDARHILAVLRENRQVLRNLTAESGIAIETEKLRLLADVADRYGGAGKLSGAGGGDCGIAVTTSNAEAISAAWRQQGIAPVHVAIAESGVKEERRP